MNHLPASRAAVIARRQAAVDRSEPLSVLSLSVRPRTRLLGAGIDTVGKLAATPDAVMMALPTFGERSLSEVHQLLDDYLETAEQTETALLTPPDPAAAAAIGHLRRLATAAHEDGVTTIGQFLAALGAQPSPSWAGDHIATLLAIPLEVLADPTMAPHYGWRDGMTAILDDLNGRSRAALLETSVLRPGGPRTLEQVGQDHNLTRERIRQLRLKTAKRLGDQPVIRAAAHLFSRLLEPACPAEVLVDRGFDPADDLVQVLASVASYNDWLGGNIWTDTIADKPWYGTGTAPSDWVAETIQRSGGGASVADLDEAFNQRYRNTAPNVVHTLLQRSKGLRVIDHRAIEWSGSLLDKAIRVLEHRGEPMTTEELIALVEPNSGRSLEGQLLVERKNGSRVIWTVDKRWALPDWDVDAYTKGEDLMAQIIEESGGKASLRRLTKEVQARGGFKPSSVQMWATMSPRFVYEDQAVRCRRPDEPIPVPPASATGDVYRRLDDPKPGSWSTSITINYESIRTNSTSLPLAFVALLGVDFGADLGQTIECNGVAVSVSWRVNNLRLHSSAGWRTVCESLGAKDGDRLIFTATGPSTANARLLPPVAEGPTPTTTIRDLIGGDGTDDILTDVAWAIGFDGQLDDDFTLDDINARLADRRENDLRDALVSIHPELDL
jgi:hypothetical protein